MSKTLCGVAVDQEIYKKYSEKLYTVKGDPNGGKRALRYIEIFARSKDYKDNYQEFAAECKRITEDVSKEIQAYYAAKDGRKEYKVMRHETFSGYIKDLHNIQVNAAKTRKKLKEDFEETKQEWYAAERDKNLNEYEKTEKKMAYLNAEKAYGEALKELRVRTIQDAESIRAEFNEHILDFYTANGNRLDDNVIRLLNSGIKLQDAEINHLVTQNKHNPTMLRVINQYCKNNTIDNMSARVYGTLAASAGGKEHEIFNEVLDIVNRTIGMNERTASVWVNEANVQQIIDGAVAKMDGQTLKPEVSDVE